MSEVRLAVPPYGSVCMIDLTDVQYKELVRLQDGRPVVFEKLKRLALF